MMCLILLFYFTLLGSPRWEVETRKLDLLVHLVVLTNIGPETPSGINDIYKNKIVYIVKLWISDPKKSTQC